LKGVSQPQPSVSAGVQPSAGAAIRGGDSSGAPSAEGAVFNPFGQGLGGPARIGANASQPASTEADDSLLALILAAGAGGALWYLLRGAIGD
jgi:hypothetical protein